MRDYCRATGIIKKFYGICSMAALKNFVTDLLTSDDPTLKMNKFHFYHPTFSTDDWNGICEDGSSVDGFVRYINSENNRAWRMKMGKLVKAVVLANNLAEIIPEEVQRWYEEQVTTDWKSFALESGPYQLHFDDDFERIYRRDAYASDSFGSCMVGKEFVKFYRNGTDAKAAYLTNEYDEIVARAIVFTKVRDEENSKTLRLCERQYAEGEKEQLKKLLVNRLIAEGLIDGYKAIGASCHDAMNFVANDGTSLSDHTFSIRININRKVLHQVPYMDSFKYFNFDDGRAYNDEKKCYDAELTSTDGVIDTSWDDLHEEYTMGDSTFSAYYHGDMYYNISYQYEDDFVCMNGDLYHEDDLIECPCCGEYMRNPEYYDNDGYYSNLTDEVYCCYDCLNQAEQEYKEEHWHYAEVDDEYYEDEDDVTKVEVYNFYHKEYTTKTISVDRLEAWVEEGDAIQFNGKYYYGFEEVRFPFGYEAIINEINKTA